MSWHYLTDGILEIGYKEEKGKLKVIGTIFHEDYQIEKFNASLRTPYDGHILPIDKLPD